MTDVEKYGLFALVFVISILGLAWLLGPDEALPDGLIGVAGNARSVVLERPDGNGAPAGSPRLRQTLPRRGRDAAPPKGASREQQTVKPQAARYTVAPLLDIQAEFRFDDAPVSYPGERSAALPAPQAGFVQHTIQKNETLSDVSKRFYGTHHDWRVILKANPGLDETKLQVGQVISVPRKATKGRVGGARESKAIYVVREGDTLGDIALRELGNVDRTSDLFAANRDVMASPDKLKVGMHLRIP